MEQAEPICCEMNNRVKVKNKLTTKKNPQQPQFQQFHRKRNNISFLKQHQDEQTWMEINGWMEISTRIVSFSIFLKTILHYQCWIKLHILCLFDDFTLKLMLLLILCKFPSHQFPSLTQRSLRSSTPEATLWLVAACKAQRSGIKWRRSRRAHAAITH